MMLREFVRKESRSVFFDAFRTNSRNIFGRNPSMVIPLLASQDLAPMLIVALSSSDISYSRSLRCFSYYLGIG